MNPLIKFLLFHVLISLGQNVSAFGSEIINGHKAEKDTMQYMAYLEGEEHMCGGFLISEDFVMTAAHCAGVKTVTLGTHNRKKVNENMRYGVERECKHPDYVNVSWGDDIMLLQLSRRAQLGENIKLVKIPTRPTALKANQMCTVAGWGLTAPDGYGAAELQVVDVPVIDPDVCKRQWGGFLPKIICAGGYNNEKRVCNGDSGGPLVCDELAVGIVSFAYGNCKYSSRPNIYTDISKFLPWINNILQNKQC